MRLVFISDTHLMHTGKIRGFEHVKFPDIPDGDVLIHCGDSTFRGTPQELAWFLGWFTNLPFLHKVWIAGNHEVGLEHGAVTGGFEAGNATYLRDSAVVIDGIKFYGSPWQPEFNDWAFNLPRGKPLADKWALIPDDTDVLITHGPPFGVLDLNFARDDPRSRGVGFGCKDLFDRVINHVKPKIHAFGHIHGGYGQLKLDDTLFINAAMCDEQYRPVNKPVVIDWETLCQKPT